jgi:short-subunit dehydrogenase
MSPIIAVIGASRGIGLELANQLSSQNPDTTVISATRTVPSSPLLSNVQSINLDLTNDDSIAAAAKEVPELDTLIINAAMGYDDHLSTTSSSTLLSYLDTNIVGPNRIIQAFLPALLTPSNSTNNPHTLNLWLAATSNRFKKWFPWSVCSEQGGVEYAGCTMA